MDNRKQLGTSDLRVSPLAFGGNVFGWTLDEAASFKILDAFVDAGFNFIDTADSYSRFVPGNKGGESETIIGKWMKKSGKRHAVVLATKLGSEMGEGKKGLSAKYMKQAVEDSLRRLRTDHIDLYQSHYDDPATPVEETMAAFHDLVREGKVRYIGASNLEPARIKASNDFARQHGLSAYISLQPLYNLYDRKKFEEQYAPLAQEERLAVIPYYALASGFLTGKYRSEADLGKSARGQSVKKYLDIRGRRILAAMDKAGQELGAPLSQIAIAWLLQRPGVTAPIASATNERQLQELVGACALRLDARHIKMLDDASEYL